MCRLTKPLLMALLLLGSGVGQTTQHGVTLSCTGATGATFSVYRSTTSGGETKPALASGLTSCAYNDTTIVLGTKYYYTMTQTVGGVESGPSNEASAQVVQPDAPTNPKATVY